MRKAAGVAFAVDDVAVGTAGFIEDFFAGGGDAGDLFDDQFAEGADVGGGGVDFAGVELPGAGHLGREAVGDGFFEGCVVGGLLQLGLQLVDLLCEVVVQGGDVVLCLDDTSKLCL